VLKEKAATSDLITNDLIEDINKFDAGEIESMAKGGRGSFLSLAPRSGERVPERSEGG